jgi:hypothetical protein
VFLNIWKRKKEFCFQQLYSNKNSFGWFPRTIPMNVEKYLDEIGKPSR